MSGDLPELVALVEAAEATVRDYDARSPQRIGPYIATLKRTLTDYYCACQALAELADQERRRHVRSPKN